MAPEKRTAWLILYEDDGQAYTSESFKSKKAASDYLTRNLSNNAPVVITEVNWEA